MKQAILITAYRDEENLIRLLRHFSNGDAAFRFRIFVHIDKKSKELSVARIKALNLPNVYVVSKYSVCWGSVLHIRAVLDLMREMLFYDDVSYVHVISGSELAVRPAEWFVERFAADHATRFNAGMSRMFERSGKYDWYCRYWLPTTWNHRNRFVLICNVLLNKLQIKIGLKRRSIGGIKCENIWYSHIWASYPREACAAIVKFADAHRPFLRGLNLTAVPEEVFFATAIAETEFKCPAGVPYLRYSNWDQSRGAVPVVLDDRDFKAICDGDYAFVRKVDSRKSASLIRMIDREILPRFACRYDA